jgi:hypothetical protein
MDNDKNLAALAKFMIAQMAACELYKNGMCNFSPIEPKSSEI